MPFDFELPGKLTCPGAGPAPADDGRYHLIGWPQRGGDGIGPPTGPADVVPLDGEGDFGDDDYVILAPDEVGQNRVRLLHGLKAGSFKPGFKPFTQLRLVGGLPAPPRTEQPPGAQAHLALVSLAFPPAGFTPLPVCQPADLAGQGLDLCFDPGESLLGSKLELQKTRFKFAKALGRPLLGLGQPHQRILEPVNPRFKGHLFKVYLTRLAGGSLPGLTRQGVLGILTWVILSPARRQLETTLPGDTGYGPAPQGVVL